jgi:hypothetical protein
LKIKNLGKVSVRFSMIETDADSTDSGVIEPNKPMIIPASGMIEADQVQTITIRYWPGVPKMFTKTLQLQISHFAPEEIILHGEAGFADLMLDLPRFEDMTYQNLKREAKEILDTKQKQDETEVSCCL